ncbi:MAG: radical SAM family heme chaperone HemW [Alphaproteobacteria bacterium]
MKNTASATGPAPSSCSPPPASPAEWASHDPNADPGFGIYVHWPFCASKCPYCDFNSHVREDVDQARWRAALLAELEHMAGLTPGRAVTSIFFGGGTPSLMPPETVAGLIDRARELWPLAGDAETTLEANPGDADSGRFQAYRAAGINRLSLGVQSFDDDALAFLGRRHDAAQALAAIAAAHAVFARVSFDLIYARPGQSVAAWRAELAQAVALAGDHLSVYQLTIEPGTPFHTARRLGELATPEDDHAAALYEATQEKLTEAGLPAYEISNHASEGGACRHNLTYWRYGDYAGIGPGAHGRLTLPGGKHATRQIRSPERWLEAVEARGHASAERRAVAPDQRAAEMLMMGLRLASGVGRERFAAETGMALEAAIDGDALARLAGGGFVATSPSGLRATSAGRPRLDAVLAALLA